MKGKIRASEKGEGMGRQRERCECDMGLCDARVGLLVYTVDTPRAGQGGFRGTIPHNSIYLSLSLSVEIKGHNPVRSNGKKKA